MEGYLPWILFNLFILAMLALDLGVFHRKAHVVSLREALTWTGVWVALALIFNAWIWYVRGSEVGLQFLTGYVVEKSLSVDNVFVFVLIFSYFQVPALYQHKVLFWGILGALAMRAAMIFAGVALIKQFHWLIYVFGVFLIITGIKMVINKDKKLEPEKNPVVRLFRKMMPVTKDYVGDRFFTVIDGVRHATPLFIVLLIVEFTDLIFAVDSIPAIIAITQDTFIVYTSNVFAILGLRSLYFAMAGIVGLFHYLVYGLSTILVFIGIKMVIVDYYKVPIAASLAFIAVILTLSVVLSIMFPPKNAEKLEATPAAQ